MFYKFILASLTLLSVAGADPGIQAPACQTALHSTTLPYDLDDLNDLRELLEANRFQVGRNFHQYTKLFPFETSPQLIEMMMMMPQNSIWFDMGAGEGNAIVDGLNLFSNFKEGIATSYKKPTRARVSDEADGRFSYLDGDFIENMARRGLFDPYKGKVQLITDVFGPLSYSPYLPQVFQIYFDLLAPKGILLFTMLHDRNFEETHGSSKTLKLLDLPKTVNSFIIQGEKKEDGLIAWLKTIPGIEVLEVTDLPIDKNEFSERVMSVKIRKKSQKVSTPWNLETGYYHITNPPHRIFHINDDK